MRIQKIIENLPKSLPINRQQLEIVKATILELKSNSDKQTFSASEVKAIYTKLEEILLIKELSKVDGYDKKYDLRRKFYYDKLSAIPSAELNYASTYLASVIFASLRSIQLLPEAAHKDSRDSVADTGGDDEKSLTGKDERVSVPSSSAAALSLDSKDSSKLPVDFNIVVQEEGAIKRFALKSLWNTPAADKWKKYINYYSATQKFQEMGMASNAIQCCKEGIEKFGMEFPGKRSSEQASVLVLLHHLLGHISEGSKDYSLALKHYSLAKDIVDNVEYQFPSHWTVFLDVSLAFIFLVQQKYDDAIFKFTLFDGRVPKVINEIFSAKMPSSLMPSSFHTSTQPAEKKDSKDQLFVKIDIEIDKDGQTFYTTTACLESLLPEKFREYPQMVATASELMQGEDVTAKEQSIAVLENGIAQLKESIKGKPTRDEASILILLYRSLALVYKNNTDKYDLVIKSNEEAQKLIDAKEYDFPKHWSWNNKLEIACNQISLKQYQEAVSLFKSIENSVPTKVKSMFFSMLPVTLYSTVNPSAFVDPSEYGGDDELSFSRGGFSGMGF